MTLRRHCCRPQLINNCTEFYDWLATKTQLEVTIASQLYSGGHLDCTSGDCQAVIDGTYILTKIPGSFGGGSCNTEGFGRTFAYTFPSPRTMDCLAVDDPYYGLAVYFVCAGSPGRISMSTRFKVAGGECGAMYGHEGPSYLGIDLPADLSSGTLLPFPSGTGAYSNACVPTSAPMTWAFL